MLPSHTTCLPTHPTLCRIALQLFASGLFQAGYRDRAAAIYSTLLLQDADRVQQAELLRRCLRWGFPSSSASGRHVQAWCHLSIPRLGLARTLARNTLPLPRCC